MDLIFHIDSFSYYRKLLKINLAVFRCMDTEKLR